MSTSDGARQARALEDIARSVKGLDKSVRAINDNMVQVGKMFRTWLDAMDDALPETDAPIDRPVQEKENLLWTKPGEKLKVYSRSYGMEGFAIATDSSNRVQVQFQGVAPVWVPRKDIDVLESEEIDEQPPKGC